MKLLQLFNNFIESIAKMQQACFGLSTRDNLAENENYCQDPGGGGRSAGGCNLTTSTGTGHGYSKLSESPTNSHSSHLPPHLCRPEINIKKIINSSAKFTDEYAILDNYRHIGQGSYGIVYKAKSLKTTSKITFGEIVAVKKILASDLSENEIIMHHLSQANCQFVPKIYDIYLSQEKNYKFYYLIMEFCAGGEVYDYVINSSVESQSLLPESEVKTIFKQLVLAIEHLHEKLGIAHQDLKLENLMLMNSNSLLELRLIDFGFAGFAKTITGKNNLTEKRCTPYYAAPEMFKRKPHNQAADIWALGVILTMLLTGAPPFYSTDDRFGLTNSMETKILSGKFDKTFEFENLSADGKDLIQKMLTVSADLRIDISAVKKHPFLSKSRNLNASVTDSSVSEG